MPNHGITLFRDVLRRLSPTEVDNNFQTLLEMFVGSAGMIGKRTQADLYADLAHPANTLAMVVMDADQTKDGIYIKNGESGLGSWDKSNDTALATAQADIDALEVRATTIEASLVSAPSPSIAVNGNLDPSRTGDSWLTKPTVQALTHTTLNALGCNYAGKFPAGAAANLDTYYTLAPLVPIYKGQWVAVSVYVYSLDGAYYGDLLRVLNYDTPEASGQTLDLGFEQVEANLRRYKLAYKISTVGPSLNAIRINVRANAGSPCDIHVTGYAIAISPVQIVDVNSTSWNDYLSTGSWQKPVIESNTSRLTVLEQGGFPVLRSVAVNGNLSNSGAGALLTYSGTAATVAELIDTWLNALGCSYAVTMSSLAAQQETYFRVNPERIYPGNCWVAASFFISATDWDWTTLGRIRLLVYKQGGGSTAITLGNSDYVSIDANTRRYNKVVQLTMLSTDKVDYAWIEVTTKAGRTATVKVTGYTFAFSDTQPGGIEWANFADYVPRLAAVEIAAGIGQSISMLIPSSIHLIQGRPLEVQAANLTYNRDVSAYKIAFAGSNAAGDRPCLEFAEPVARLDGNRLSGAGAVWARKPDDGQAIYKRVISYTTSAAAKTGSPKILVVGDSLSYQGTISAMNTKLSAAGVTPTYIGTFPEVSGLMAEGRPSWRTTTYTRKEIPVNADGSGVTYPIDATGGDGVVTSVAQYLALSTVPGDYAARWKYNPFIRPATGGDNAAHVFNGYIFDMRFYLDRFSHPDPDIVMIELGTNDHSNHDQATAYANCLESINIIYTQTRAALPNAHIAFILNGFPGATLWQKIVPYIKSMIDVYGDREAEKIYILPVYMTQDPKFIYDITVSDTDVAGMQTGVVKDWVHSDAFGRSQWAEMTYAFVMCMA